VRKAAESIGLTIGMAVAVMFYMFMGAVAMVGIAIMSVPDLLRAFVRFLVYWDVEIFRKAFWPNARVVLVSWLFVIMSVSCLIKLVQVSSTLYLVTCILPILLVFMASLLGGEIAASIR